MPDGQIILLALALASLVALAFAMWERSLAQLPLPAPSAAGTATSWCLIGLSLFWRVFLYEERDDTTALLDAGLSSGNLVEVAVVAAACAWAGVLIGTGRVQLAALVAGSSFWLTGLLVLFLTTSLWSIWPSLTLFRCAQWGAFWIIALHVFSRGDWLSRLQLYLLLATAAFWLDGLLNGNKFSQGIIFGAIYRNDGSFIAGALFLVGAHCAARGHACSGSAAAALGAISIVVFGSLTTALATAIALLVMVLPMIDRDFDAASRLLLWGLSAATVALGAIAVGAMLPGGGLTAVAWAFEKDTESISSMTGRLPLWSAIWDAAKDNPFGFGYAAADRVLLATFRQIAGWTAGHSHNGFISAYLSAGWLGTFWLIATLIVLLREIARSRGPDRSLGLGLLTLTAVNNLTFIAYGGPFVEANMLVMSLVAVAQPLGRAKRGAPVPIGSAPPFTKRHARGIMPEVPGFPRNKARRLRGPGGWLPLAKPRRPGSLSEAPLRR